MSLMRLICYGARDMFLRAFLKKHLTNSSECAILVFSRMGFIYRSDEYLDSYLQSNKNGSDFTLSASTSSLRRRMEL